MSLITGPSPVRRSAPLRALIGAVAAAALVAGAGASTAGATADGCTYTEFPHEYVCATVHGKKLNVEKVVVIRGKLPAGVIDDYHAEVNVYTPAGKHLRLREQRAHRQALHARRGDGAHQPLVPGRRKICGAFFERGGWIDSACFKIHD